MTKTACAAAAAAFWLAAPAILPGAAAQSDIKGTEGDRGRLQRLEAVADGVAPEYVRTKGRQVFLDFTGDLQVPEGARPGPFELCADGVCTPASAAVAGERIVLSSDRTPDPDEARYCWDGATGCSLSAADGAPVPPFRVAVE